LPILPRRGAVKQIGENDNQAAAGNRGGSNKKQPKTISETIK
jgi:hypothetical protein